jgi:hypothetical protein
MATKFKTICGESRSLLNFGFGGFRLEIRHRPAALDNGGNMNEKSLLNCLRLPARLDVAQTAEVTGFLPHEISMLMYVGLLKPLGKPAQNGHKFFCTAEILELSQDRNWLDKATRAVARHWQERNSKAKEEKKFAA